MYESKLFYIQEHMLNKSPEGDTVRDMNRMRMTE